MIQSYVVGFLFTAFELAAGRVLLIEKRRPQWQAGKLNGIGGKIEVDERAVDAMRRECREEAGLDCSHWDLFARLTDHETFELFAFRGLLEHTGLVRSRTDEEVGLYSVLDVQADLTAPPMLNNIPWLVAMAAERNRLRWPYEVIVGGSKTVDDKA